MHLVLWDIDGTLVRTPHGRQAFDRALTRLLGSSAPSYDGVAFAGRTDPQIAADVLAAVGADVSHLPTLLSHAEEELASVAVETMQAEGRVLPGVTSVLAALAARDDVVQSVLTGNTAANAAIKLAAFGLDRWLDASIGAYGSDDADRRRLVPVAVARARALRGFDGSDVWVVGDTPHDFACAAAGGARCLLVATGGAPRSSLDGLGADAVLDDLSDVDAVVHLLTGSS